MGDASSGASPLDLPNALFIPEFFNAQLRYADVASARTPTVRSVSILVVHLPHLIHSSNLTRAVPPGDAPLRCAPPPVDARHAKHTPGRLLFLPTPGDERRAQHAPGRPLLLLPPGDARGARQGLLPRSPAPLVASSIYLPPAWAFPVGCVVQALRIRSAISFLISQALPSPSLDFVVQLDC